MLRVETVRCPVCDERALAVRGSRLACEGCNGALVPEDDLRGLIAEASKLAITDEVSGDYVLVPATTDEAARTCPRCTTTMTKHELRDITIDRCGAHGIWFDGDELARLLKEYGLDIARVHAAESSRTNPLIWVAKVAVVLFVIGLLALGVAALALSTHDRLPR